MASKRSGGCGPGHAVSQLHGHLVCLACDQVALPFWGRGPSLSGEAAAYGGGARRCKAGGPVPGGYGVLRVPEQGGRWMVRVIPSTRAPLLSALSRLSYLWVLDLGLGPTGVVRQKGKKGALSRASMHPPQMVYATFLQGGPPSNTLGLLYDTRTVQGRSPPTGPAAREASTSAPARQRCPARSSPAPGWQSRQGGARQAGGRPRLW